MQLELQNELGRLIVEQNMLLAARQHLFRSIARVSGREAQVSARILRLMTGKAEPARPDPCDGVPRTNTARVLDYLRTGPKTVDEIAAELKRQRCSQPAINNVRQTVYCLMKKKLVCRQGRGRWRAA